MYHLDHAQSKLPILKLWLGDQEIAAEVALTQTQVATGMMFRQTMGENEGMLFVFGAPHRTSFYMKNTTVPLTAAYIDPEGTILELQDLQPLNETAVEAQSDQIQYVLEMKQGWFKRHAVAPGAIATDMVDRFAGKEGETRDYLTSLIPVGRIGASEQIAAAVLYLCSDDAKFTTGTSLVVDGGLLAQ